MTQNGRRLLHQLTPRECQLLISVCDEEGDYVALAARHQVSLSTLKGLMSRLYDKAGVDNRLALVMFSLRNGIAPCPCLKHQSSTEPI